MTSNRFFCSGGVIRQCLRQHGWIGLLYLAGLLFTVPLPLFMSTGNERVPTVLRSLFDSTIPGNELQNIIFLTVPVLAGVMLLRFIQRKGSSDLYHSLPLRREHLLSAHLISGLILLLVPIWLTAGVTALLNTSVELSYIFYINDIGSWALVVSVLTIFLFTFTVFVGICVGQSLLQAVVVYVLLLLPFFLYSMISRFLGHNLYGYSQILGTIVQNGNGVGLRSSNNIWYSLSPFVRIMDLSSSVFSYVELLIYMGVSLLFVILGYVLYRKRLVEKATQAMAFTFFQPFFKAGVMLCAMLLIGEYFYSTGGQGRDWSIFGYVLGAILGYIAVEMVIRKTWQIVRIRALLELVAYGAVLGLAMYIPTSSWIGYEERIPTAHSVEQVYAGQNLYLDGGATQKNLYFSQDKVFIAAVLNLQRELVSAHSVGESAGSNKEPQQMISIAYRLDDGTIMTRSYTFPEQPFRAALANVMLSEPYKTVSYSLDKLYGKAETISIQSADDNERRVVLTDPEDIREFEAVLKEEVLGMSYSEMQAGSYALGNINIVNKPSSILSEEPEWTRTVSFNWRISFHKLNAWLERKGYADKVIVTSKDIISIRAIPMVSQEKKSYQPGKYIEPANLFRILQQKYKVTTIEDPKLWNTVLDNRNDYSYDPQVEKGTYLFQVKIKSISGSGFHTIYYLLTSKDITPELAKALPTAP
ncbi:multidrug ABC transporter permease [Paenibacillus sp. FSL M8-0228]|uniref:multidrug ABC transporter permease n=1 Tax=Paenibacillus TaxID=44249 RepID=UPI00083CE1E4|nr:MULTISPECIES: multidrug ABC transporter permease [Paenibacillus]MBO3283477.1 multidrug ABC transporter permease [Paenibacillus polymyxa]MBP1311779.1 ABC-2 type transport system permease protein [Paenibacillus sp. 1182]ODB58618.1 multidrug ABC transporter permease [Paenibacillus polymyxa]